MSASTIASNSQDANSSGILPDPNAPSATTINLAVSMLLIFSFLGIMGNSIVLLVYSRRQDRQTASFFIVTLAISDLLACTISLPFTCYLELNKGFVPDVILCRLYLFLNNSSIMFSSLLLVAIAFDRYFCICHPFKRVVTLKRSKIVVGLLVLCCSLHGICTILTVPKIEAKAYPNQYECLDINGRLLSNWIHILLKVNQITQGVSYLLCVVLVFALYLLIYRRVTKARTKRKELKGVIPSKKSPRKQHPIIKFFSNPMKSTKNIYPTNGEPNDPNLKPSTRHQSLYDHVDEKVYPVTIDSTDGGPAQNESIPSFNHQHQQPLNSSFKHNDRQNTTIVIDQRTTAVPMETNIDNYDECSDHVENNEKKSIRFHGSQTITALNHKKFSYSLQNMKTAAMLFVVTIVYLAIFLPAILMVNGFINLYLLVFYAYYMNNVVNPFIYGFMNKTFREDVQYLFSCQAHKIDMRAGRRK